MLWIKQPDLIFLKIYAMIGLIRSGVNVLVFNQRSVDEILNMVHCLSRLVDNKQGGEALIASFNENLTRIKQNARKLKHHPKVYFEEWNDPMISGIRWVSELISLAGGIDCFEQLSRFSDAKSRIIADTNAVVKANPDIIIGSWCGKKFQPEKVKSREGWDQINAVKNDHLFEIKSPLILQPGPAALTDGVEQLAAIITEIAG